MGPHCTCYNLWPKCINTNIFSSISPSVYVVFSQLTATNACGAIGSSYQQLTATFAQNELSTITYANTACLTLPFNFTDLNGCSTSLVTSTTYSQEEVFIPGVTSTTYGQDEVFVPGISNTTTLDFSIYTGAGSKCSPSIALGAWVTMLDPAWASCTSTANWNPAIGLSPSGLPIAYGPFVWDPPHALVSVNSLLDPTTTALSSITVTPAAPSAAPQSVVAITSTAGAPLAPISTQAGANPPVASGPESQLSHTPLGLPPHLDGGTSNLAQSAETTGPPPSGSSSMDPPASDAGYSSYHAESNNLLSVTAFSVAGDAITPVAGSPGIFVMSGVSLTQGAAQSVNGDLQVSWAPGSIFINGKGASIPATQSAQPPQPAASLAGVFAATAVEGQPLGGAIVVSGSTIIPGAAAVAIDNVPYSMDLAASHIVIGGQTKRLSAISPQPTSQPTNIVIAGQTVSPAAPGASIFIIGDKTLSLNGPAATISNTLVSLAPGGNIIIGSSTLTPQSNPKGPTISAVSYFTIGSETFIVNPGKIVAAGTTLTPGGPGITVSGTPVSLAPGGNIIIGTSTLTPQSEPTDPTISYFTVGSETFAVKSDNIVAAGMTLTPGGPGITVSDTPVSLGLSALIIGTETEKVTVPSAGAKKYDKSGVVTATTSGIGATVSYFTVGSETFAVGASDVVMDGKTLTPGSPEITVSGIRVSLGTSALIVGTRTEVFSAATPGATDGIGGLIISGLGAIGGGAVATGAGDPPAFVGAAVKRVTTSGLWLFCVIIFIVF